MLNQYYQYTYTAVPPGYAAPSGKIAVGKRGDEWVARWVGCDPEEPDLRAAGTERELMLELCRVGMLEWVSGNVGLEMPFICLVNVVVTDETRDAIKVQLPGTDQPQWVPKRAMKSVSGAAPGGNDGYRIASWFEEQNKENK